MGIHFNDLQTASLIQEKHSITLADCARSLGRSVSSIKRSISAVNEYLPPNKVILIENNCAVFQMSYQAYMDFIQSLSLDDYVPSQDERLDIMAVYGFLNRGCRKGFFKSCHQPVAALRFPPYQHVYQKKGQQGAVSMAAGTGTYDTGHPQNRNLHSRKRDTVPYVRMQYPA